MNDWLQYSLIVILFWWVISSTLSINKLEIDLERETLERKFPEREKVAADLNSTLPASLVKYEAKKFHDGLFLKGDQCSYISIRMAEHTINNYRDEQIDKKRKK